MKKPRPTYGISRIDQPDKKNHGFYVRITHNGKQQQKFFSDKTYKGKNKALAAARKYRDSLVAKLPKSKQEEVSRPRRKLKKSGQTGVTHVIAKAPSGNKEYNYWQASWEDKSGVRKTAKFSFDRYGEKEALRMAINARRAGMRGSKPSLSARGPVKGRKATGKKRAVSRKTARGKKKAVRKAAKKKAKKKAAKKKARRRR